MSDWLFLCGMLSGVTTWLFGFGGGFVTVPLLYLLVTGAWGAGGAHDVLLKDTTNGNQRG